MGEQQFKMRYVTPGGFRGYPMGTIAYYGPGETDATKAVASVIKAKGASAAPIKRWTGSDLMNSDRIQRKIAEFFQKHRVRTVLESDRTLGPATDDEKPTPAPATPEDIAPEDATPEDATPEDSTPQ